MTQARALRAASLKTIEETLKAVLLKTKITYRQLFKRKFYLSENVIIRSKLVCPLILITNTITITVFHDFIHSICKCRCTNA